MIEHGIIKKRHLRSFYSHYGNELRRKMTDIKLNRFLSPCLFLVQSQLVFLRVSSKLARNCSAPLLMPRYYG